MKFVGSQQYRRLIDALRHYERAGFKPIAVPWAVSKEAMDITRPAWAGPETLMYHVGGFDLCPVASAEQSFLQLQLDARARGAIITGDYVTMTPCFRNEPVLDDLHQPYFMKVELITWDGTHDKTLEHMLQEMLSCVSDFFNQFMDTAKVPNLDPDPIGEVAIDIVGRESGIELGSYGIRHHPRVGRWLYGTGCAEPRFSHVIEVESGYSKAIKASF